MAAAGSWLPVPCAISASQATPAVVAVDPAKPVVTLRTTGTAVALGEDPANVVGAGLAVVSLAAWDVGCGVAQLALRIVPSPYRPGRMLLEVEVADGAGNRRTQGWHVARHGARTLSRRRSRVSGRWRARGCDRAVAAEARRARKTRRPRPPGRGSRRPSDSGRTSPYSSRERPRRDRKRQGGRAAGRGRSPASGSLATGRCGRPSARTARSFSRAR